MRLERHPRQQIPPQCWTVERFQQQGLVLDLRQRNTAGGRRVALEVPRIHLDPPDRPRCGEADDRPVVSRSAPPPGLPAVAHVRGVAGHDQVVPRSKEHVAARDDETAVLGSPEIDFATPPERLPVCGDAAVDAQPRDAAVGVDAKAHVRRQRRAGNRQQVLRVAAERRARQDLAPRGNAQHVDARHALSVGGIDGTRGRKVSFEVGRVDVHAGHVPARAQAHDAPVVALVADVAAAAARLPPVHPLSAVGVLAFDPDRRLALDQVFLRREKLVVRGDGRTAEAFARQIHQIEEGFAHSSRPAPERARRSPSQICSPRRNVACTTPLSVRRA